MSNIFSKPLIITILIILSCTTIFAQQSEKEKRMEWFSDARFGMFLHWGVYSTFGGEWNGVDHGKEMGGASAEWIYLRADIPKKDYEQAAYNFNPVNYNPSEWLEWLKMLG